MRAVLRHLLAIAAIAVCVTAVGVAAPGAAARPDGIEVRGAWIREAPPGAEVLAAYMDIRNKDAKPDVLFEIRTPIAEVVSIHRTVVIKGVARMEHMETLPVPARTTVRLKPGGDHLMIMFPERLPKVGAKVPLALRFRRGGTVWLEVPVKSAIE